MPQPFVPEDFEAPAVLVGPGFHLEPLGPRHNDRDHEAWMSSIEWIRSTPGYGPDADWPTAMDSEANLRDLEMHARDFENRAGFTYSVVDGDEVIGCVYIYPSTEPGFDVLVRSWVRASRKEMDLVVRRSVGQWIDRRWPFDNVRYARGPDTPALSDPRLIDVKREVVQHGRVGSLEEAAVLRGVHPSAVIKTIVVRRGDDDYIFALVPGDRVVDWPKLRELLGARRLSMPDAEEAFAVTGYVRGTITPFGAQRPWPVVADSRLLDAIVSVGGGAHGVSITINGSTLVSVLEATAADITKERS